MLPTFRETETSPPARFSSHVVDSDAMSLHQPKPRRTAARLEGSMVGEALSLPKGVEITTGEVAKHIKKNQDDGPFSDDPFDDLKM